MAIQTIYTQVDNAKLEQCKKGKPVLPVQIPLLRNNYLGEYRTQAEKDKVLKNLGILGATGEYTYPSENQVDSYSNITTVAQALDYCIRLIKSYETSDANIKQLLTDVETLKAKLEELSTKETTNAADIKTINTQITAINNTIASFDQKLQDLNVDDKITKRLHQHLDNSTSITFTEDLIEVKNSAEENNAIEIKDDGLYVSDTSKQVKSNTDTINTLQEKLDTVSESLEKVNDLIKISDNTDNALTLEDNGLYVKDLSNTVSANTSNITAAQKNIQSLTSSLTGYVKTNSDASLKSVSINKITSTGDTIAVDKPFNYTFNTPSDARTHVKSQADLLKINPATAWKGMPVVVEDDAIMYILTKEPTAENIGVVTNWKSADSLSIEVLTYDEYKAKKNAGILNPGVYYYIIEDEIELSEIPSINQYMDADGKVSDENLEAYQAAIDAWYVDAEKLHREYMSAIWGVDMENKLSNKVNKTDYDYLKNIVETLKSEAVDPDTITELQNQLLDILGNESATGRLVKVENNATKVLQDLYATDTEGNIIDGLSPKFVTWEQLGSESDTLGEGDSLFVKSSTYKQDKESFLYKNQQASIPSVKATEENFIIEQKDSSENLLTIKKGGGVYDHTGQLGYDTDIPILIECASLDEYKQKIQEEVENPNNKAIYYIIKDLDPETSSGDENCYITFAQLKQYAASRRQVQDLSNAWGTDYRSEETDSYDQLGNQIYNYTSLAGIVRDWKNTVIPAEITKQLTDKVSQEELTTGLATKVETTAFDEYKTTTDKSIEELDNTITSLSSGNIKTLQNSVDSITSRVTTLETSKVDNSTYQSEKEVLTTRVDALESNRVTTDTFNNKIEEVTQLTYLNKNLEEITYNELKEAITNSTLSPGTFYRMTDFVTSVDDTTNYSVNSKKFDLVIQALSANTINSICSAISTDYPNANKWRLEYSIDGGTKGTILRMTDEFGNTAPFDFKSILIKKYKVTNATVDLDSSDIKDQWIVDKYIGSQSTTSYEISTASEFVYTFSTFDYLDASLDSSCSNNEVSSLGNIIFGGNNNKCLGTNNIIYTECNNVVIKGSNNLIGGSCSYIFIDDNANNNIIYDSCQNVIYDRNTTYNLLFAGNSYIHLYENCTKNKIAKSCSHITLEGNNKQCNLNITQSYNVTLHYGVSLVTFEYADTINPETNRLVYANVEVYGNKELVTRTIVKSDTNQSLITTFYLNTSGIIDKFLLSNQASIITNHSTAINTLQKVQTEHTNTLTSLQTTVNDIASMKVKINEIITAIKNQHSTINITPLDVPEETTE